ncbi:MAG: hypothetical protein ACK4N5_23130, partial [Myxococcales bacterium]
GAVRLPRLDAPVQAGEAVVEARAAPGAEVRVGEGVARIGPDGAARLPLLLRSGDNAVVVALSLPDGARFERRILVRATPAVFGAGLVGVQLGFERSTRELSASGSGAGFVETTVGATRITAGVNLDASDVLAVTGPVPPGRSRDPLVLTRPRAPYAIERAIDPESAPVATNDDGTSGALNPAGARAFAHLRHPEFGSATAGAFHASLAGAEVGQYHRSLVGVSGEGALPLGKVTLRGRAFGAAPAAAAGEAAPVPGHDELFGTGGSLFYLRHGAVVAGSEKVRVEVRDPVTGLPLEERVLVRDLDYQIDYRAGRIILGAPLPMAQGAGPFLAQTPLDGRRPVLIVDYEHRPVAGGRAQVVGGRVGASTPWGVLFATAVRENRLDGGDAYQLGGVHGRTGVGGFTLSAGVAQSRGFLFSEGTT